jgi:hypothetical protein
MLLQTAAVESSKPRAIHTAVPELQREAERNVRRLVVSNIFGKLKML